MRTLCVLGGAVLALCSTGCSCGSDDSAEGGGGAAGSGATGGTNTGGQSGGGGVGGSGGTAGTGGAAGSGGGAGTGGSAGAVADAGPDADAGDAGPPMCTSTQPCTWKQATPQKSPPTLAWSAMAYDPIHDQMILFGGAAGINGGAIYDQTWAWTGSNWVELTPANKPSARWTHGMVYDEKRQRIVLFGGQASDQAGSGLNDTWEWTGSDWVKVTTSKAPSPRGIHGSIAYDSLRERTVIRGGGTIPGQPLHGDTWEYDGTDWKEVTGTGPGARVGPALTFDKARGTSLFFGGGAWNPYYEDTWTWDGTTWKSLTPNPAPSKRQSARSVYDPSRGLVLLFGGDDGTLLNDLWEWNGASWAKVNVAGPPPRCCYAFAHDTLRGEAVMFGGPDNQTWIYGN